VRFLRGAGTEQGMTTHWVQSPPRPAQFAASCQPVCLESNAAVVPFVLQAEDARSRSCCTDEHRSSLGVGVESRREATLEEAEYAEVAQPAEARSVSGVETSRGDIRRA